MGPFTTAVTPDDAPRVDLGAPAPPRDLDTVTSPVVGDRVTVNHPGQRCYRNVTDGDGPVHSCYRVHGHDRTQVPCTGVRWVADGSDGSDVYEVRAVAPLVVPLSLDDAEVLRADVATQRARADKAERTIMEIREYALEQMRASVICESGTREFLEHFGLPLWSRDHTVTVELIVHVDAENDDDAESKVTEALSEALGWRSSFPMPEPDITTTNVEDTSD